MASIKFAYGLSTNFASLSPKDDNTLYFLTDTLQIFKGANEYTKSVKLVSSLPQSGQVQGVLYVNTTDFTLHVYNGTQFVQINKGYATAISGSGDDNTVPTTGAVATYVTNKIEEVTGQLGDYVTDVTYTPATGTLAVTKDGEPESQVLTGVAHNPTYDSDTRTITIPTFGGEALVIALGKDAFVKSGSYDDESKQLDLVLTSGEEVHIPVGSLVDIYTGLATSTATTTVSGDNQISVTVKVSATANNAITVEGDGLYVPVPDAYTKAQVDQKISDVNATITAHTGNADIHVTKEQKTSWDAKASTEDVATAKQEAISAAAADAKQKADQALADAKTYANGLNEAMDTRVSDVEDALEWQDISTF